MESDIREVGTGAGNTRTTRARAGTRSRKGRKIEPYAWLAAGAVSVGIAAALTGAGMAHADDAVGDSTSATSSVSAKNPSANSESSSTGPANSSAGSDDHAVKVDTASGDDSEGKETADRSSDEDLPAASADDINDTEELAQPTNVDAQIEADDEPNPTAAEDSGDSEPSATQPVPPADNGPTLRTISAARVATSTSSVQEPDPTEDVDPSPSESSGAAVSTTVPPAAFVDAALDSVEVDTEGARTAQASTVASVTDVEVEALSAAQPATPAAPTTLADLLAVWFRRWQVTNINQSPTARPVQASGQSSLGVVTGTVGATDPDGDPLTVELSTGPLRGSVQVSADGKFIYTPSGALAATGGVDTFTVSVRELNAASHTHGLTGMWSKMVQAMSFGSVVPDDGSTILKVIKVTVAKVAGGSAVSPPVLSAPAVLAGQATALLPGQIDAGLSAPFELPQPASGKTLNVLSYGATPNKSSDNDATAIQRAISAAKSGDVVYIPGGIYHVKSIINLKAGVSLVGQSRAGTVLAAAYGSSPHAVIYAAPGVTNLTLSSFSITTASGRPPKSGVRLGVVGGGLVSRIAIKDLSIEKFERFGILLQNAYHVLVDGNIIRNATALDGGGSGYGVIIDQSKSNNNWVKNNVIGPVIRHGILIQENAHHNLIEYNRVTGAVSGAIDLHGEDEYSNEIRYNIVSDCVRNGTTQSPNGAGIEVGEYSGTIGSTVLHDNSGANNYIHHNEVYNCSCGFRISNNSNYTYLEDNTFHNNLGAGIQADLAPLNHLYIRRNNVYSNGSGILLTNVKQAVVQGNTINKNLNYGIWTNAGVTDYTITGNTVTNNRLNIVLGSQNGTYIANGTS